MLIDVKDLYKIYERGKGERGPGPGRGHPVHWPGGVRSHHRRLRFGQIHPHEHSYTYIYSTYGGLHPQRHPHQRPLRPAAGPHPQQGDRLYLPGLQPDPRPYRLRERGAPSHLSGGVHLPAGGAGDGGPEEGGHGLPPEAQARRDVRRPAAAGCHRPSHRHPPTHHHGH